MGTQLTAVARKQLPLRPAGPDTVSALLAWYDDEGRDLPWRVKGRRRANPWPWVVLLVQLDRDPRGPWGPSSSPLSQRRTARR